MGLSFFRVPFLGWFEGKPEGTPEATLGVPEFQHSHLSKMADTSFRELLIANKKLQNRGAFCLDVRTLTFCQPMGFPEVKLLAGEQKATETLKGAAPEGATLKTESGR